MRNYLVAQVVFKIFGKFFFEGDYKAYRFIGLGRLEG